MSVAKSPLCTVQHLRSVLSYDPTTGSLRWLARPGQGAREAGCTDPKRHIILQIQGRNYRAGRVVWAMHYGSWPPDELAVDHADRDPQNNRIDNLRLASVAENARNGKFRDGCSGFKGVTPKGRRWQARIKVDYTGINLGTFATPEEAHVAYLAAAAKYFGEFAPSGSMRAASA